MVRSPGRILIGQNSETRHLPVESVKYAVVVSVHAPGKIYITLALHLDMHKYPLLVTVCSVKPHQLINVFATESRLPDHLLQFLVKKDISAAPVHIGCNVRKKEPDKLLKVYFQSLLPGTVIICPVR